MDEALRGFLCKTAVAVVALVLAGCKIEFEASTVVASDGSLLRTTRYVAHGHEDRAELESRYALPEGGVWKTERFTTVDPDDGSEKVRERDVYQMTRHFSPGEPIDSDYLRRGESRDLSSDNEIRLTVHDYIVVRIFEYEETFRDVASGDVAARAIRDVSERFIAYLADILASKLQGLATRAEAVHALRQIFDPRVEHVIDAIPSGGRAFSQRIDRVFDEQFEDDYLLDELTRRLAPAPEGEGGGQREAIARALEEVGEEDASELDVVEELLSPFEEEEAFGVHASLSGASYEFSSSLVLPGEILEHNATRVEAASLVWEFEPEDFMWNGYTLRARSRVLFPVRIALSSVAAFLSIVLARFLALRGQRRSAGRFLDW